MRQLPDYGIYPWWPENGTGWIHPEDLETASSLIPGERIFRRDGRHGRYILLRYGDHRFRVLPTLWQPVAAEGFDVGDEVEVRSLLGKNDPGLAVIREMLWDADESAIRYRVEQNKMLIPKDFAAADLRHVDFLQ